MSIVEAENAPGRGTVAVESNVMSPALRTSNIGPVNHWRSKSMLHKLSVTNDDSPFYMPRSGLLDIPSETSLREKVRQFVEGMFFQSVTTIMTIFALWGDDFLLAFLYKGSDDAFQAIYFLIFLIFSLELMLMSMVVENYKWSFFFWLDMVATATLLLDVSWLTTWVKDMYGSDQQSGPTPDSGLARLGRASRDGTRAGRIVRIVRLVRLLRVVDVSKIFGHKQDSDEDAETAKMKGPDESLETSQLGRQLSEQTTKTVIIGLLCMMIALPFLAVSEESLTFGFGLENIFWFGLSACTSVPDFLAAVEKETHITCRNSTAKDDWITDEGYQFMLYEFSQLSRYRDGFRHTKLYQPLLYLKVLDIHTVASGVNGPLYGSSRVVKEIRSSRCTEAEKYTDYGSEDAYEFSVPPGYMPNSRCSKGSCCWESHELCANFDPRCPWREAEMTMVTYTPPMCKPGTPCQNFFVSAIYLNRYKTETESIFNMLQTTFIVILLGSGAVMFSNDTQVLVITPIEKMARIVQQLADDPLSKPDVPDEDTFYEVTKKTANNHLDTAMLENTILKIGGLLQIGFGEAGAQIIGKNMALNDGELNILAAGRMVVGVFGFCNVRDFMETTECLLEEVMVFVNKLARIVHLCVHEWDGSANKNLGDGFFVTWMLQDGEEIQRIVRSQDYAGSKNLSELADKALIAFLKIEVEIRRASDLIAYARHPRIFPKFGMYHRVTMGYGLHLGWAVEGAIGSSYKVDASYLSPHVSTAARLQRASKLYGVELLFSNDIYQVISQPIRDRCRQLDSVVLKKLSNPKDVYTFYSKDSVDPAPEDHEIGRVIPPAEMTAETLRSKGTESCFMLDLDMVKQEGISLEFQNYWRQGLRMYILGKWELALHSFEKCVSVRELGDGPSECILKFMQLSDYNAPDDWPGYRELTNLI